MVDRVSHIVGWLITKSASWHAVERREPPTSHTSQGAPVSLQRMCGCNHLQSICDPITRTLPYPVQPAQWQEPGQR